RLGRLPGSAAGTAQHTEHRRAAGQGGDAVKGLIFTWLLTLLGASSCIITPFYGFLAYVALAILRPDFLWSSHISGGRFSLIVASAMLLSWTWHAFGNWRLGAARRIVLLFAGFWLWSVFLAVQAP